MSRVPFSRRQALAAFAQLLAASPALRAQQKPQLRGEAPGRIAPHGELVNTFEFAAMAQRMGRAWLDRTRFAVCSSKPPSSTTMAIAIT